MDTRLKNNIKITKLFFHIFFNYYINFSYLGQKQDYYLAIKSSNNNMYKSYIISFFQKIILIIQLIPNFLQQK